MNSVIRKFKIYLLINNYPPRLMDRYLSSVHRFLFRYHADLKQLDTQHFESFYDFLRRKQYHPDKINDYMTSLRIFSTILERKIETECFNVRKKLHHKDEVLSK